MLIDTHCHLESPKFHADRAEVIDRAIAAGVGRMVCIATTQADASAVADICAHYDQVYMALGLHPHEAKDWTPAAADAMTAMAAKPKVVAWGEIGLDYHYDLSPRDAQRRAFAEQLQIARQLGLPVIVHSREADADTLDVLRAEADGPYRGVFHCFAGDIENATRVLDLGFIVSFTGVVTFKPEMPAHDVIRHVGSGSIMVETDAPYMAPRPLRGQRCEPAHVAHTAARVAEILGMAPDAFAEITTANAVRLFGEALA
jgi:TatD DNase family protein